MGTQRMSAKTTRIVRIAFAVPILLFFVGILVDLFDGSGLTRRARSPPPCQHS